MLDFEAVSLLAVWFHPCYSLWHKPFHLCNIRSSAIMAANVYKNKENFFARSEPPDRPVTKHIMQRNVM